ncbi:MAG: hypothetical protein KC912_04945 [Proteobacteria bacterium]|nr:hypothetical protein [Pseudomonadota bacterium]
MILLLATTAFGGGYFHPDDLAGASTSFARASEAAPIYEEAESTSRDMAASLTLYEENLDLLGDRAPAAERERLATLLKAYNREQAQLQAFAGALMEDFDQVFTGAMERAVAAHPDAVLCETVVRTRALPGMPAKEEANPDCKGENLNAAISAAMDADPVLTGAIDELLGREWPAITQPTDAQAPIGGESSWVSVDRFFEEGAKASLTTIRRDDENDRLPIAAALEEGADPASQLELAHQITEKTAARRASFAAPVFAATDKALAKRAKKGKTTASWCANPSTLGGCTGENANREMLEALLGDKKVAKALP